MTNSIEEKMKQIEMLERNKRRHLKEEVKRIRNEEEWTNSFKKNK